MEHQRAFFTQDVNSFTHCLYLQNLEIISLPEKKVCFVSQLNSDFPRPVELIDAFKKVRHMDLNCLMISLSRHLATPPQAWIQISGYFLRCLEDFEIFRNSDDIQGKNCDIQNFVKKNVLKSCFFLGSYFNANSGMGISVTEIQKNLHICNLRSGSIFVQLSK